MGQLEICKSEPTAPPTQKWESHMPAIMSGKKKSTLGRVAKIWARGITGSLRAFMDIPLHQNRSHRSALTVDSMSEISTLPTLPFLQTLQPRSVRGLDDFHGITKTLGFISSAKRTRPP